MAAAELGYRPDVRAQSLAGQRSRVIGVMFGVTVGAFHFELLDGLFAAAESHGHNLVISPLTESSGRGHGGPVAAGVPVRRVDHAQPTDLRSRCWRAGSRWRSWAGTSIIRGSTSCGPMTSEASTPRSTTWSRWGTATSRTSTGATPLIADGPADGLPRRPWDGTDWRAGSGSVREGSRRSTGSSAPAGCVPRTATQRAGRLQRRHRRGRDRRLRPARHRRTGGHLGRRLRRQQHGQLSPVPLTSVAQRPDELGRLAVERMVARVEQRRIVDREIVLAGRAAECGRARPAAVATGVITPVLDILSCMY